MSQLNLKRRRVLVMCVRCYDEFRYMYSGSGPYRSVCNKCVSKSYRKARR